MYKRCENCRHWDRAEKRHLYGQPKEPQRYAPCKAAIYDEDQAVAQDAKMVPQDYESYRAWLLTRDDHVCGEWAPIT